MSNKTIQHTLISPSTPSVSEERDGVVLFEVHAFVCLNSRTHCTSFLDNTRRLGAVTGVDLITNLGKISFLFYLCSPWCISVRTVLGL